MHTDLLVLLPLHLLVFGIVELYLYRRYDYLSMYLFRLTYYAWWHGVWGVVRLG